MLLGFFMMQNHTSYYKVYRYGFCRTFHHVKPIVKSSLVKPAIDLTQHDLNGECSDSVLKFIKARNLENAGGKKVDVYSLNTGERKGTVELNNFVFGTNPRIDILQRNVVWYRACIRAGTASAKTRAEVRGGGRKPWPQKGTGKARHGSIRSPLWRGGGKAWGPRPKDWSYNLPYKVRRMGIRTALSCKLAQGDLTIVEDFDDVTPDVMRDALKMFNLRSTLLVDGFESEELLKAAHPFDKLDVSHPLFLHVYGMLIRQKLVLSLQAVHLLEEKLCEDNRIVTDPQYSLYHHDMLLSSHLMYQEYDPKLKKLRGRLIPNPPKNVDRKRLPMSRQDKLNSK